MRNILSKLIITTLAVAIPLLIPFQVFAASTISLSPSTNTTWPYRSFSVQVLESSGTTPINAVLAKVTYPIASLTCTGISVAGGAFVIPNSDSVNFGNLSSCSGGAVTIVEGVTGTGISGSSKLVATINFKVNASPTLGAAAVSFASGSAVVNGSTNTNDLGSSSGGSYNICKMIDLDCNGTININDAGTFLTYWQTRDQFDDIDGNGTVNINDAGTFLTYWQTR